MFHFSIINFYKSEKTLIFLSYWLLFVSLLFTTKLKGIIGFLLLIILVILSILTNFVKCRPYKNSEFLKKNRDSIILGIVFFFLGIIAPYGIELLIKLIKNIKMLN